MSYDDGQYNRWIVSPAVNGGVTAGMMKYLAGAGNNGILVFGTRVPILAATGALGFASSWAGDLIHDWLLPHLSPDRKFSQMESAFLAPTVAGAVQVGVLEAVSPGAVKQLGGQAMVFGIGAASYILGQYVYENLALPLESEF